MQNNKAHSQEHLIKLYYLIADFQRHNRFFVRAQDLDLSLLESRLLTDLAALPELRALEISKYLEISPTQISRALKKLEERKFIKQVSSSADSRFKDIVLTKSGVSELNQHDQKSDLRLETFEKNFKNQEKVEFRELIHKFASGFELIYPKYTRTEHPLRNPIRRVTQALGMLERKIFGIKDLSSIEWQVLTQIELSPTGIIPKNLADNLQIPGNTLSDVIKRINAKGFLTKLNSGFDQRLSILSLSTTGKEYLENIKVAAIKLLKSALKDFTQEQQIQFIYLLNKFIYGTEKSLKNSKLEPQLIRDQLRISAIREFCIVNLARLGLAVHASHRIIDPSSQIYALYEGDEIIACLEIQKTEDSEQGELLNFTYSKKFEQQKMQETLILKTTQDCLKTQKFKQIKIKSFWLLESKGLKKYFNRQLGVYLFGAE